MNRVSTILKVNKLSVTEGRQKILQLFLHTKGALSHADIERKTGEHFDRVTIYRTLNSFVDKGIIHVIPSSDNSIKYALCKDDCEGLCQGCGANLNRETCACSQIANDEDEIDPRFAKLKDLFKND